jgi:hypothetical protein
MIGLLIAACTGPTTDPPIDPTSDVTVTLAEPVPTVATWTWSEPGEAWVEVLDGSGAVVRAAPSHGDGPYAARIVGLAPQTAYSWRLTASPGGEALAEGALTTGARPASIPTLARSGGQTASGGGLLLTTLISQPLVAAVLDERGDTVWWHALDAVGALSSRVAPTPSGPWFGVFRADFGTPTPFTGLIHVGWSGEELERIDLPGYHHDFGLHGDGSLFALTDEVLTVGEATVRADRVVEIGADRSVRTVWRAEDVWTPEALLAVSDTGVHANSLVYLPDRDAYAVGLRDIDTVVIIDRATGATVDRIGGPDSTWTLTSGSWFEHQHQLHFDGDRLVLLDNRAEPGSVSRAVAYDLDAEARTLEEAWSYPSPDNLFVWGLGGIAPLPTGETRVVWSTAGQIDELDAARTRTGQLNSAVGVGIGYATWVPDLSDVEATP